jgi:ATP-dependent Clp protease ATP-binding subunit ClpC
MFERFTDQSRALVVGAQQECRRLGHDQIDPEHVLLALLAQPDSMGTRLLTESGVDTAGLRDDLARVIGRGSQPMDRTGHIPFHPQTKQVLELSLREALQLGDWHIGTEHILLALLHTDRAPAAAALREAGVDLDRTRQRVRELRTIETFESRQPHPGRASAAEPDPRLAAVRAAKDAALDRGDFRAAATLRAQERELLGEPHERGAG